MNLLDAQKELVYNAEAGNATLLQSGSGLGKSSIVWDTYKKLSAGAAKGEWGFGISFAATMNPIDMMGVPFKGTHMFELPDGEKREITVTDPTVPLWCLSIEGKPAFCYRKFFLFIDEYGQGNDDARRGLAEVMLSGRNGYWSLPEGSPRVAATNVGSRYGVGRQFDFEIARRSLIKITGDTEVTLKYLDKPYLHNGRVWHTMPVTKAWAATPGNSAVLFENEPKEQGPWCNPRSLCAVDRNLQVRAAHNNGVLNPNDPCMMEFMTGTAGMPFTQSYVNFLQYQLELPSYESVVSDPVETPIPKRADQIMLMVYMMADRVRTEHLAPVLTYVQRLSKNAKDMEVTFVSSLMRRDAKSFFMHPALLAWTSKNATLVALIQTLSAQ